MASGYIGKVNEQVAWPMATEDFTLYTKVCTQTYTT